MKKGLFTDTRPGLQPPETTRFTLNAIQDGFDGNMYSLSNEPGNEFCFSVDGETIGTISLPDETVIFSVTDSYSEIGIVKNCNYTSLVKSECLGFSKQYPIKGVSRIKNCNRIIYFYDGFNVDRQLDLDNLTDYLKDGFTLNSISINKWDCSKFSLKPSYQALSVEYLIGSLKSNLPLGGYAFAFAYIDNNNNYTDYFTFTPVLAVDENESIILKFNNIDTTYQYLQVALIYFTDIYTSSVYLLPKINIYSDNQQLVISDLIGVSTTIETINIPLTNFLTSEAMTIIENRLLRASLIEPDYNWTSLQRLTQNAKVRWVVKEKLNDDFKSFRRDEIYAIGLVYVFKDGTESPVFMIPGREANPSIANTTPHWRTDTAGDWDTELQTVVATVSNPDEVELLCVEHLGLNIGSEIERWKVFNTAYIDEPLNNGRGYYAYAGQMGYYESSEQYPETKDCNGKYIFGDLVGQNIRYHRMPDLTIAPTDHYHHEIFSPLYTQYSVYDLGIEISGIQIQDPNIIGYRIVYSRIDNPTVVDTGILEFLNHRSMQKLGSSNIEEFYLQGAPFHTEFLDPTIFSIVSYGVIGNNSKYVFHSADSKFRSLEPSNYLVLHSKLIGENEVIYDGAKPTTPDFGEHRIRTRLRGHYIYLDNSTRTILDNKYVGNNTISEFDLPVINAGMQEIEILKLNSRMVYTSNFPSYMPNYSILDQYIEYPQVSLKRNIPVFDSHEDIVFVTLDGKLYTTDTTAYGGDTYINKLIFRKTQRKIEASESNLISELRLDDTTSIIEFYTESKVPVRLREEGENSIFIASDGTEQKGQLFYNKSLLLDDFLKKEPEYFNYYKINNSTYAKELYKEYRTLDDNYNYCESCKKYPYINWSEESFETDTYDNFRKFRINNVRTVPSNRGDITNILYYRNKLLIFTDKALFGTEPNPQKLFTDISTVYLGTAEFLSLPISEVIQSEHGFAGTSGRFNIKATPSGVYFVDIDNGMVYRFYDGLDDISKLGMHNFFQERSGYYLNNDYVTNFQSEYELLDNPLLGVSTISTYDPRYERYIITKADFKTEQNVRSIYVCIGDSNEEILYDNRSVNYQTGPISTWGSEQSFTSGDQFEWTIDFSDPAVLKNLINPHQFLRISPRLQVFLNSDDQWTGDDFSIPPYIRFHNSTSNTLFEFQYINKQWKETNSTDEYNLMNFSTAQERDWMGESRHVWFNSLKTALGILDINFGSTKTFGFSNFLDTPFQMYNVDFLNIDRITFGFTLNKGISTFNYETLVPDVVTGPYVVNTTQNPISGNYSKLEVIKPLMNSGQNRFSPQSINRYEKARIFGVYVPQTAQWSINFESKIFGAYFTPDFISQFTGDINGYMPTAYLLINQSTKIPLTIQLYPEYQFYPYEFYFSFSYSDSLQLNQNDTLDFMIDNLSQHSILTLEELSDVQSAHIYQFENPILTLTTPTDTTENCFYTFPEDMYTVGTYTNFTTKGYPASVSTGIAKMAYLSNQPNVYDFYVNLPSTTFNSTPYVYNVSPSAPKGLYELHNYEAHIELIDVSNGDIYTVNVYDNENNVLIGTFEYNSVLSTAKGYDVLSYTPTGTKTWIKKNTYGQLFRLEISSSSSVTTEVDQQTTLQYYECIDAKLEVINIECSDFIIQERDSIVSLSELGSSLANITSIEKVVNYFTCDITGIFDLHFNNDIDVTNPLFEYHIYLNGSEIFGVSNIDDPNKLFVTIKDLQLYQDDEIMLTVKYTNTFTNNYTGEWLTTLVKKDYSCIEALPKENKSFTISYSAKDNSWTSFHSYIPKLYFDDKDTFYSTKDLKKWYKHVDKNYTNYYDTQYPHIIEFVVNEANTFTLNSLMWIGKVETYDELNKEWIESDDQTYNKFLIYNSKQSTGYQDLSFDENPINWSNVTKRVIKSDYNYRLGGIRDISISQPVNTSSWSDIESTFNQYGYIDRIPLSSSVNYNISMADLAPLRDKYQVVRLIYNGNKLYRISIDLTATVNQYTKK